MFDDPQPDDAVDMKVREFNCWIGLERAVKEHLERVHPASATSLKAAYDKLDEELKRSGKRAR